MFVYPSPTHSTRQANRWWYAMVLCCLCLSFNTQAEDTPQTLTATPVMLNESLGNGARIGKLRILGMLELSSPTINGLRLAELSDLVWDDDENILYAVSDQGSLFGLRPVFKKGYLTDISLLSSYPLRELGTRKPVKWRRTDAEGLAIYNGYNHKRGDSELLISFEREPRIMRYRNNGYAIREYPLPEPLNNVSNYRSSNKTLEAVTLDPHYGILTMPEVPLENEPAGFNRLFTLNGKSWAYPQEDGAGVVALEPLENNQLLVLERNYQPTRLSITVTLKKVTLPAEQSKDNTLHSETLATLSSNDGYKLDNFEGLTRHRGNRFFMVSDNNDVFIQRTLLLYFEIVP